jgi:hypothetical protein
MAFTKIAPAGLSTTGTVAIQNINATGIITATSFVGSGSGLTGVGIGSTGSINTSGIITATSFSGDGSQLTNLSGMGVAAGPTGFGADVFYTNTVGYVSATTTIASVDASLAPILYTRYQEVVINDGFDLIVGNGNDLLINVFQLS